MSEHALLSASGAARWLSCAPSARFEARFPDTTSESAREGTFAHALAELKLKRFIKDIKRKDYEEKLAKLKQDPFYSNDLQTYVDEYVGMVEEKYMAGKKQDAGASLIIEAKLNFDAWVPQGFGRGDAIIIADGDLEICDLKYGKHVPVNAENNPQLRLYALGAINEFGWLYDLSTVTMTINQPRNGGQSSETLTEKELLDWGASIRAAAEKAYKGEGEYKVGTWCRFCKGLAKCKAYAEYCLDVCKQEAKDKNELTDDDIVFVLSRADSLTKFVNSVKTYALGQALNGHKWSGFKLVEGRSIAHYSDEKKVAARLKNEGYTDIYKPRELLGITAMKKQLTTKVFNELVTDLLEKPQGKPTLVPETDKRPEFNSAADDFNVIE